MTLEELKAHRDIAWQAYDLEAKRCWRITAPLSQAWLDLNRAVDAEALRLEKEQAKEAMRAEILEELKK